MIVKSSNCKESLLLLFINCSNETMTESFYNSYNPEEIMIGVPYQTFG